MDNRRNPKKVIEGKGKKLPKALYEAGREVRANFVRKLKRSSALDNKASKAKSVKLSDNTITGNFVRKNLRSYNK